VKRNIANKFEGKDPILKDPTIWLDWWYKGNNEKSHKFATEGSSHNEYLQKKKEKSQKSANNLWCYKIEFRL